jgi:hypothetical protein
MKCKCEYANRCDNDVCHHKTIHDHIIDCEYEYCNCIKKNVKCVKILELTQVSKREKIANICWERIKAYGRHEQLNEKMFKERLDWTSIDKDIKKIIMHVIEEVDSNEGISSHNSEDQKS